MNTIVSRPLRCQGISIRSAACCASVVGWAASSLAAVTITDLGILTGGTNSYGYGVNANGTAVVGTADHSDDFGSGDRAFRWTVSGGMQDLGVLDGGASSGASGISYDGNFVTGTSGYFGGTHAFRWNAGSGIMEDLGELPGGSFHSSGGHAINASGDTVVGNSYSAVGYRAFRWRAVGGIETLGQLPGGFNSNAMAVNADGTIAAGLSDSPNGNRAFRWNAVEGMKSLGILAGQASYGWAINGDGTVIVGKSDSVNGTEGFRWTAATGMVGLGLLPGSPYGSAHGVSADGSVIVGVSALPGFVGYHAFIWTSALGMKDLQTYLPTLGVDLTGWTVSQALAISADGTAITGNGVHNGKTRAFIIRGLFGGPACPADLNHDGQVDDADFVIFLAAYNILDCADQSMPANCPADLNGDHFVDDADFVLFVGAYDELLCP